MFLNLTITLRINVFDFLLGFVPRAQPTMLRCFWIWQKLAESDTLKIVYPNYTMTNLNLSLPDTLGEFIDQQIKIKGYPNASEYISHLIRQEQEKETQKQMEILLLDGLNSGQPIEITDDWWENQRKDLINRLGNI